MSWGKVVIGWLVFIIFLVIACAPREASIPQAERPAAAKEEVKVTAKEAWEERWETTLQAARKEGRVLVYASSPAPALKELAPTFQKKFGIILDVLSGRGSEIRARLLQERAHGLYLADIVGAGLNTTYGAIKNAGMLEPIEPVLMLPEVIDPKMWYGGKLPFLDKERMVTGYVYYPREMIAINNELVKPGEITSFDDLPNPKWKGKILINDPTVTGSGFSGFSGLIYSKVLDPDFFRQLISENQPVMLRDQLLQVNWLARGKYLILLWPRSVHVSAFQKEGAPIAMIDPKEGTSLSSHALTMVNKAAHPEAAKIFINWVLTREPQTVLQNAMGYQSSRLDVPTEGLDPTSLRRPGVKYFIGPDTIEEWVVKEQDNYLKLAKQVFGPLSGK